MFHLEIAILSTLAVVTAAPDQSPSAAPVVQTKPSGKLTVDSLVKDLIGNPKTDAVLRAEIPEARLDERFVTAGANLPLRSIAQFDPLLTDDKLKHINEELSKAQASK